MAASRTRLTRPLFGQGSRADDQGYDLQFLIGWLEDMIDYEDERAIFPDRRARLEQAEDAVELLRQVGEWTPLLTRAYKAKVKAGKAPPSARKV